MRQLPCLPCILLFPQHLKLCLPQSRHQTQAERMTVNSFPEEAVDSIWGTNVRGEGDCPGGNAPQVYSGLEMQFQEGDWPPVDPSFHLRHSSTSGPFLKGLHGTSLWINLYSLGPTSWFLCRRLLESETWHSEIIGFWMRLCSTPYGNSKGKKKKKPKQVASSLKTAFVSQFNIWKTGEMEFYNVAEWARSREARSRWEGGERKEKNSQAPG